jgi:cytochrome b561
MLETMPVCSSSADASLPAPPHPIGLTALVVLATIALAELVRRMTTGQEFATQQTAAIAVVVAGLLVGAVALLVSCVRAFRRVKRLQQAGETGQANAALRGLVVVAVVLLLPLVLAIAIPQQPAPILAP